MMSGGSGFSCADIFQFVLTGVMPVKLAIADFPECAPFETPGGLWVWP